MRIRNSVRFVRTSDDETSSSNNAPAQLFFEHTVDCDNDRIFFAFTYPYSYSMLQNELAVLDNYENDFQGNKDAIIYHRELLTESCSRRRIDLITITSAEGVDLTKREPLLSGLFPTNKASMRPYEFPHKEVIFISARVHSGEVPAQHTWRGMFNLLMDKNDLRAKELRRRYVIKMIPMLNPDGVFHGHFRMDQHGQNLNRYYSNPDSTMQPAIFAAKSLLDHYAKEKRLCLYIDLHAHASKRGCFIYGNVLDSLDDQIQNQLFCKLVSLNSAHFDYEGCLFSREHMVRIDPGDAVSGLTAEGSGRVATYLAHGLIHSYTLECNYNTSKVGNEIAPTDGDPGGQCVTSASPYTTLPEKYTPATWAGVGRACLIALLDIRGHNPCSRIPKSKFKTLDRVRQMVLSEVRMRKEYRGQSTNSNRRPKSTDISSVSDINESAISSSHSNNDNFEAYFWRRTLHDTPYRGPDESAGDVNQKKSGSAANGNGSATNNTSKKANPIGKVAVKLTSAQPAWPVDLCSKAMNNPVPLPVDQILLGNQQLANHSAMYARAAYKLEEQRRPSVESTGSGSLLVPDAVIVKPLGVAGSSSSKTLFSRIDEPVTSSTKPAMFSQSDKVHNSNDDSISIQNESASSSARSTPRRPTESAERPQQNAQVGSRIPRKLRAIAKNSDNNNNNNNSSNQAGGSEKRHGIALIDPGAMKFKEAITGMTSQSTSAAGRSASPRPPLPMSTASTAGSSAKGRGVTQIHSPTPPKDIGHVVVSDEELESLANMVVNAALQYSENVNQNSEKIADKLPALPRPRSIMGVLSRNLSTHAQLADDDNDLTLPSPSGRP